MRACVCVWGGGGYCSCQHSEQWPWSPANSSNCPDNCKLVKTTDAVPQNPAVYAFDIFKQLHATLCHCYKQDVAADADRRGQKQSICLVVKAHTGIYSSIIMVSVGCKQAPQNCTMLRSKLTLLSTRISCTDSSQTYVSKQKIRDTAKPSVFTKNRHRRAQLTTIPWVC